MSGFLQSQADALVQVPASASEQVNTWREHAMAQAQQVGFPHNKLERWKYAPLRALAGKSYAVSHEPAKIIDIDQLPPPPRIVFVNGRYDAQHSDTGSLQGVTISQLRDVLQQADNRHLNLLGRQFKDVEAPFSALNTALAQDGVLIEIAEHSQNETALHCVFISQGQTLSSHYARHLISCAQHSQFTLIEHHLSDGNDNSMSNHLWHVHVKPHAVLNHARLQNLNTQANHFSRTDAVIAGHAHYNRFDCETGSHFARHELTIDLQGEHAQAISAGVTWATQASTLDTRLVARHQAPNTQCQLLWRGLANDKAKCNFYGGITIDKGADGSNASLSNKNLLLSPQAQINTQPALEIYADEVKAAHGATVGQLDQNALFYLQARGVPKTEAQQVLTQAFYAQAYTLFEDTPFLAQFKAYLPKLLSDTAMEHSDD
jgi:Fe-S cluster assembly protein SufD